MANNSEYILHESTRDGIKHESGRLDFQHYFCHDTMNGELLPPHITKELAACDAPRVCEIATGSAIWLREIPKTLPASTELLGLDVDTAKFPKAETLPSNIRLELANAYEPFPDEYQNRFDVVHLRHFILATKKDQCVALIQNLLSLLRPGGWFVWAEASATLMTTEPPSDALFEFQKVFYKFISEANIETGIPLAITSYMEQAGLANGDHRYYNSGSVLFGPKGSDWIAREHHEFFETTTQILKGIVTWGGVDRMRTEQDADELRGKLREDISGTRICNLPLIRAWAQKPSLDALEPK